MEGGGEEKFVELRNIFEVEGGFEEQELVDGGVQRVRWLGG